ncbi:MAG: hypothetical protein V1921_02320 [Candidatus Altiarchaeota archaeon]
MQKFREREPIDPEVLKVFPELISPKPETGSEKPRILVVDDNPEVHKICERCVQTEGGSIVCECDPVDAGLILKKEEFDIIFLNTVLKPAGSPRNFTPHYLLSAFSKFRKPDPYVVLMSHQVPASKGQEFLEKLWAESRVLKDISDPTVVNFFGVRDVIQRPASTLPRREVMRFENEFTGALRRAKWEINDRETV